VREGRGWRTECQCEHGYTGDRCLVDRVQLLEESERSLRRELETKKRELRAEESKVLDCNADKDKVKAFADMVRREMKELPGYLTRTMGHTVYEEEEGSGPSGFYC